MKVKDIVKHFNLDLTNSKIFVISHLKKAMIKREVAQVQYYNPHLNKLDIAKKVGFQVSEIERAFATNFDLPY